ncbi:MAG: hypothetical protein M3220_20045 [Chloroflexota bacterium]|nr:hypothetical protein [Chloroflexota bacterium]
MAENVVEVDWYTIVLLSMLFFAFPGWRKGWQRALVTLVSLFFAWGVALQITNLIVKAMAFVVEIDTLEETTALVRILLYVASTLMVVVTFNSRMIPIPAIARRDRFAGISAALLSGYFFVLLLLDLGREWLVAHLPAARTLVFNSNVIVDGLARQQSLRVEFINNPITVYEQLSEFQNLALLVLLLVFFRGLLFWLFGRDGRTVRTPANY